MPRRLTVLVLALLAVPVPTAAHADGATLSLLRECQNGVVTGTYTQADYRHALRVVTTDADAYTDCRDAIRRAQLAAAGPRPAPRPSGGGGGGGGTTDGGGGGAATLPPSASTPGTTRALLDAVTPAERDAIEAATRPRAAEPVEVGGRAVNATVAPAGLGAANTVPVPLAIALALLAVGLVAAARQGVRSLRSARHPEPAGDRGSGA